MPKTDPNATSEAETAILPLSRKWLQEQQLLNKDICCMQSEVLFNFSVS